MVIYCILTGLAVYYIALWLWYRYTDSRTSTSKADDVSLPQNKVSSYTLVGESRYKSGLIGTAQDKSGHLPQTAGNDTIFAPQAGEQSEENISEATPEAEETPGYENDEPDYVSSLTLHNKAEIESPSFFHIFRPHPVVPEAEHDVGSNSNLAASYIVLEPNVPTITSCRQFKEIAWI